ncbi:MAG: hypothetical protein MK118_12370 [Dehalococcoidia bacterium]|nr:hypothetical protein [Dehalococcoidia bacterium]
MTTDRGETYGPFTVNDATTIYRFDTQFTAKRLRFELLGSSSGSTGALEIEVYGRPVNSRWGIYSGHRPIRYLRLLT